MRTRPAIRLLAAALILLGSRTALAQNEPPDSIALRLSPVDVAGSWSLLHTRSWAIPVDDLAGARLRNQATVSLAAAISGLPGVHDLHTGAQVGKPVIRGLTGARVLVLENGFRMEDYSWSSEDGPSVDARLADRVEVVRGPASLLYGSDALGGAVNAMPRSLFADEPAGVHLAWEGYGATNNREFGGALLAERRDARFGWRVFGVGRSADDLHTPSGKLGNTGFGAGTAEAAIGGRSALGSWDARLAHHGGEFKLLEAGETAGPGAADGGPERKATDDRLQLATMRHWGTGRVEARAQWQRHTLIEVADEPADSSGPPVPGQESEQFHLLLNTLTLDLLDHHQRGRLSGTAGISGNHQSNDTQGPIPLVPDASVQSAGAFVTERYGWDRIAVLAGVRGDLRSIHADANSGLALQAQDRDYHQLSGMFGAVYSPAPGWTLTGNVGRAWRAPTLFELFTNGPHLAESRYEIGRASLEPEHGVELDAGVRLRRDRLRAEVDLYRNRIHNFIFLTPTGEFIDSLRVYQHEQALATLEGGEASVEYEASRQVTLRGRLDAIRGQNETADEPLPLMPPVHGAVGFEIGPWRMGTFEAVRAEMEVEIAGRQTRLSQFDTPTAGYALLNAEVGFSPALLGHSLRVEVRGRNLTDHAYRDYLSRYKEFALDPGRNLTIRVSSGL